MSETRYEQLQREDADLRRRARDVEIETGTYEREHGRKPRGGGQWGFCPLPEYHRPDYLAHVFWANTTTYAEAKRLARAHFAALGRTYIAVCS